MELKKIYKKVIKNKMMKQISPYVSLSSDCYYGSEFNVDLRNPKHGHVYLKTKKSSVIEGNFVFETEDGIISIGERCHIGASQFICKTSIEIGDDVTIAWNCTVYDHNSHSIKWEERKNDTLQEYQDFLHFNNLIKNKDWSVVKARPIVISDKVWIGFGVIILKGVTIGEGAVIAAGSVVTKNVEPWSLVGGNPAQELKKLKPY